MNKESPAGRLGVAYQSPLFWFNEAVISIALHLFRPRSIDRLKFCRLWGQLFRKIAQTIVRVLRRQMVRQTSMNRHRKSELEKVDRGGNALLANPAYLRANTVLPPQGGAVTKSSASIRIGISKLRSQFQYETSQIPQGWESSDAIA